MVCRTGYTEILEDEAQNVVAGIHNQTVGHACGEVTFMLKPMQHILPTSQAQCLLSSMDVGALSIRRNTHRTRYRA